MKRQIKEDTEIWLKATDKGIAEITNKEVTSKAIFSISRFFEMYLLGRVTSLSPIYTVIRTIEDKDEYEEMLELYPELKKDLSESKKITEGSEFEKFTKQDIDKFSKLVADAKGIEFSCLLFSTDNRSKIMRVKAVLVSSRTVILYTNNGNILLDMDNITEWYESDNYEFIIVSYDSNTFVKIWIQ